MKRYQIIRIVALALIFLVINAAVDHLAKSISNYISNTQERQFNELKEKTSVLVLGDSYVHDGISPLIIKNSFNYAMGSENYVQTYYKLRHILRSYPDKKPDTIILSFNLSSFNSFRIENFNNTFWADYIDYTEIYLYTRDKEYLYKWATGKLFSYCGRFDQVLNQMVRRKFIKPELVKGFRIFKQDKDFSVNTLKKKIIPKMQKIYFENQNLQDTILIHYFEKTMEMCQLNNIKVILISTPWYKEFYEEAVNNYPLLAVQPLLDKEISKFPCIITYFDFQKIFFDHPHLFRNTDHMNGKGADSLSKLLKYSIDNLNENQY